MENKSKTPTMIEVMKEIFKDNKEMPEDDCHFILFNNGTFYTFPKNQCKKGTDFSGDELIGIALEMSSKAHLLNYKDNDDVTVLSITEYNYPVYIVLSCLRQRIGWIIIGASEKWAETDQQFAAVGYLARAKYELDCHENEIIGASFDWSAGEKKII